MATILIVDDLSTNRDYLVTLLSAHGHILFEAADGRDGLAAVRSQHFDLVITDVLMPVMDGYDFVRQLRLDPATSAVPVAFYTAHYGAREARTLAEAVGVSDVLIKPATSAEVLRIVNRLLAGETDSRPPTGPAPLPEFDREHLRLLTDKLSENTGDLKRANARLRALINLGLEFAAEHDADRLLQRVGDSARDLFGATYVTVGILNHHDRTVQRIATSGATIPAWVGVGDPLSGMLKTVVDERRTWRGHNLGGDPANLQLTPLHPAIHAFLAAPIASPSHVYGWICLVCNDDGRFAADDEDMVLALAGHVGRIYELEHEILEHRRAESALRRERNLAQRYLDTAEVILLALDMDGRVTLINRKGCDLLGWCEPELIGREWIATCIPARMIEARRASAASLIPEYLPAGQDLVVTRSGEERLIEWRHTVQRDDTGRTIGTLSSGADITERVRAVDALVRADERTHFALKSAEVGIWDLDYRTGRLQWSETMERQHGLEPGTFGGTVDACAELIHPDDRAAVLEAIRQPGASSSDFPVVYRALWPDGTIRWLVGTGRVMLGENDQPVRCVGISVDDTPRRTIDDRYRQSQKMETVGLLAGGVVHDFSNLLTVILGYCGLLLEDLGPDDPQHAELSEIQKAGERAEGLTRQLLAFSRKQLLEPALLDLNQIVGGMQSMLARLISEDVRMVLHLSSEPALVNVDRGQIEQVVMNLAVNARDAMPTGGTLTITVTRVDIDVDVAVPPVALPPGAYVRLSMTDTGTGMTPEVRTRLFEAFFTTKEPGKGTGLGLATVKGIVARCGGAVGVESELGVGTSFSIYIPRVITAESSLVAPASVVAPLAGTETILVVEDEADLRELARRFLDRQGYHVLLAANAEEAVQLSSTNTIDVLITDVVMPGVSGPELVKQLMLLRPQLKAICMSGYSDDVIMKHGVESGAPFLHKPFTSETLGRMVRDVLER